MQVAREHAEGYCRETLGYKASNMRFVKGHIELLDEAGIGNESVDLVISNCVINLSPDKARVLREAHRVLAPGGEMYFSDVYCDRRVPADVQKDEVNTGSAADLSSSCAALCLTAFLNARKKPVQTRAGEEACFCICI